MRVDKVACGSHHTLITTVSDDVYVWGSNSHKQCVNSTSQVINTPTKIASEICEVAAGAQSSALIDHSRRLFVFGRNTHKQLLKTDEDSSSVVSKPTLVADDVLQVALGEKTTLVLSHGFVTDLNTGKVNDLPSVKITKIATGFCHMALTADEELWMWSQKSKPKCIA